MIQTFFSTGDHDLSRACAGWTRHQLGTVPFFIPFFVLLLFYITSPVFFQLLLCFFFQYSFLDEMTT